MSDQTPLSNSVPGPVDPTAFLKGTVDELAQVLDSKHVVGEPMVFGEITIIPLVSVGFGFGAGGGGGEGPDAKGNTGSGGGGGGGGGGGVKPVAVVIIDSNGARLETIPEPASGFERLGTAVANALDRQNAKTAKD